MGARTLQNWDGLLPICIRHHLALGEINRYFSSVAGSRIGLIPTRSLQAVMGDTGTPRLMLRIQARQASYVSS